MPIGRDAVARACGGNCSTEWWNLTIDADGEWVARFPLPVRFGLPGPSRAAEHAQPWAGAIRNDNGSAIVTAWEVGAWVEASGRGDARVQGSLFREAFAPDTAEMFLLARWGPDANGTRPQTVWAIPVIGDAIRGVALTYEARSDLCWRHASYAWTGGRGDAGALRLDGSDAAGCL